MMKTSNPQINHLIAAVDQMPMPSVAIMLINQLVEECNHKDMLLEAMKDQIPG